MNKFNLVMPQRSSTYTIDVDDLLQGFDDVDNTTLSINGLSIATDSAISGSIERSADGQSYTFRPDSNVNGVVKLSYFVSDGAGANTLANNQFTVLPINDAPVRTGAVNDLFLLEDSGTKSLRLSNLNYTVGGGSDEISGTATTNPQTLTYTITALPDKGIITLDDANKTPVVLNGAYTLQEIQGLQFTPTADAEGDSTFSFTVSDSGAATNADSGDVNSITETITIRILPVNDAPDITNQVGVLAAGTEDTTYTFTAATLLSGITDVENQADLTVLAGVTANNGTLTRNGDDFSFAPDQDFNGTVNINFVVSDTAGANVSTSASFTIQAVNDAPELTGQKTVFASGSEDLKYNISKKQLLAGFTDIEIDDLAIENIEVVNIGAISPGDLTLNANGDGWTFTPYIRFQRDSHYLLPGY